MSEEQLKDFLEKVKADTSLQEPLKAAASPEAVLEIANEAGFSITAEDIQSMQSSTVELSDEELEGAAGGYYFWEELPAIMVNTVWAKVKPRCVSQQAYALIKPPASTGAFYFFNSLANPDKSAFNTWH